MVHTTCSALNCPSSSMTNKTLRFHQFPHDAERRKIWINACKRSDVLEKGWDYFKHKYVCSLHFQKCMYGKKDHLKKSAIPSLNLSDKPLQHDTFTQTWEPVQYMSPYREVHENKIVGETSQGQNEVSILYIKPNPEMILITSSTQTEDSLPSSSDTAEIKKEIEQDTNTDTEIEDSEESEEDVEIKTEIVENEILPNTQSHEFLQCPDIEDESCAQAKKPLQEIDQEKTESKTVKIVNESTNSTPSNPINIDKKQSIKKIEKKEENIQTDKVIVYNPPRKRQEGINPQYCDCKRRKTTNTNIEDITRSQFLKACDEYLSPDFSAIVKNQVHLELLKQQVCESITIQQSQINSGIKTKKDASTDTSDDATECVDASVAEIASADAAECVDASAPGELKRECC